MIACPSVSYLFNVLMAGRWGAYRKALTTMGRGGGGRGLLWYKNDEDTRWKIRGDLHLFERLFVIRWENNRDCDITMPLSLKTMEVQIKRDQ